MAGVRIDPNNPCLFCHPPRERLVAENALAYAMADGFPVTPGHTLVIPRRHVADYFDLSPEEVVACHELTQEVRRQVLAGQPEVKAFNVGVNAGVAAGQTVFHCHFHVIPRREGDVADPRGGVRHVLPYRKPTK
jgi:diadenosine tetraphosphate (Ap4A) HIT family hydrolase